MLLSLTGSDTTPIEVAKQYIGYTEYPPNSNRTIFGEWYNYNGAKWCMIFVQYCYSKAGYNLPLKTASCGSLRDWYKLHKPDRIVKTPRQNDIAIYTFGHTGIVDTVVSGSAFYAVEGNTSSDDKGSQDNGGGVYRRLRYMSQVEVFIRPFDFEEDDMNIVKGSTTNEDNMIRAIQKAAGANTDGEIGAQTMSDIACMLGADCFPLTIQIYGAPVIIARNILPFEPNGTTLASWANSINGSFFYNGKPCSILVTSGKVRSKYACHASYGRPESVLYRLESGEFGLKRVQSADELPEKVKWAVGGLGLLGNYDPTAEGFCKITSGGKTVDFSDVLRKTNHSMIGVKNKHIYMVFCSSMNADSVNALAKKLGLEKAIMLDGGHVAGINGSERFAKINTAEKQYYCIQGVKS